jgi:hypothetical protein
MATQVINKVTSVNAGNFEPYGAFDPGKIRGFFLHRKTADFLTTAQLATVQTALQTALEASYTSRYFFVHELIAPEENGEAVTYESREQLKFKSDEGTWDKIFTINGTYADYIQLQELFAGKKSLYNIVFVDENNVMFHVKTSTGIKGFDLQALEVLPRTEPISGSAVRYQIRIALKNIKQYNTHKHTEMGFNPFSTLTGVEGVVIAEVQEVSNGVHDVSIRSIDEQENYADEYKGTGELRQVGAWSATLKDGGAAVTITSIAEVLSGTEVTAFRFTFDQTTYTNGQVVKLKLASVSTIKGYISNALESNEIEITLQE